MQKKAFEFLYRTALNVDRHDATSVRALQRSMQEGRATWGGDHAEAPLAVDGVYGRRTRAAHLATLDGLWTLICLQEGWLWTGSAVPLSRSRRAPGSLRDQVTTIVTHWPVAPDDALALDRRWARRVREGDGVVCSHCSIDEERVVWSAPPHVVCAHAGPANDTSIGVDVCVPVIAERRAVAERRGVDAGTSRDGRYLLLHPHVAARVGAVYAALERILGGPALQFVDHADVEPTRKIDCRLWRPELAQAGAYRGSAT